jgi:fatty-acyl-CoA synthase
MTLLFTQAFRWWAKARADHVAIVVDEDEITYAELDRWSNGVARWLADRQDVRTGDMVVIAGDNTMEWCAAALALMKLGAIIAPANTKYPPEELDYFIGNTAPKLVIADEGQIEQLRAVPVHGAALKIVPLSAILVLREGDHEPVSVEISPAAPAMILYTSGTTGKPKGIVHTNEMIMFAMFEGLLTEAASPDETSYLLTLPMFTSAGIYNALTRMLARGGKLIVMPRFDARRALELIMRHKVQQFGGTPVVWEQMARLLPEAGSHDFSHLKLAVTGGARLSSEVIATFAGRGIYIRQAYGITEAGGAVSFPSAQDVIEHPGTCGTGGIFAEFKTVRPNGTACEPGETGEVLIRGPFTMREYWRNPEKTAEAFTEDGWLRSGDLGIVDDGGRLRFVDRLSNLIRSGERDISPNAIEMVLDSLPGVTEIAVIAVPDAALGSRAAAIVHSETGGIDKADVLDAARRQLEPGHVPSYVVLGDGPLPRLASGKIDRSGLRKAYADLPAREKPILQDA